MSNSCYCYVASIIAPAVITAPISPWFSDQGQAFLCSNRFTLIQSLFIKASIYGSGLLALSSPFYRTLEHEGLTDCSNHGPFVYKQEQCVFCMYAVPPWCKKHNVNKSRFLYDEWTSTGYKFGEVLTLSRPDYPCGVPKPLNLFFIIKSWLKLQFRYYFICAMALHFRDNDLFGPRKPLHRSHHRILANDEPR